MSKWDVFVSYSSKDREVVLSVVEDLRQAGLHVWFDNDRIDFGERLRERINEGIKNSSAMLVFVSRRSLLSQWVLNELDAGMLREIAEKRSLVLPILIGTIEISNLPADLQGKKAIDLRHNFDRKYASVRDRLITLLQAASVDAGHTRADRWLTVGDELVQFFSSYELRTMTSGHDRNGSERMAWAGVLATIISEHARHDKSKSREAVDFRRSYKSYVNRYGTFGLVKMITYEVDQMADEGEILDGGIAFSDISLNGLVAETTVLLHMFAAQDLALEMADGRILKAGVSNGRIDGYMLRDAD